MTFPSPAVMSPTKLYLAGNNLIFPGQGELGLWTGKMANFFTVYCLAMNEVVLSESMTIIKVFHYHPIHINYVLSWPAPGSGGPSTPPPPTPPPL
jgi:hypothetical protein